MSLSKVDIANLALEHLGKNEIASLTEDSLEARRCSKWIDFAIRQALERSPWTFAGKIAALAEVTNDYEERWARKFDRPNDCVKVRYVFEGTDPYDPSDFAPHQVLDGAIYTNIATPKLMYTYFNDSPTTWPAKFAEAASFMLARSIAMPLTKKMSFYDAMDQLYERSILQAIEYDAAQERSQYGYENLGYNEARGAAGTGDIPGKAVDGSIYWET